MSSFLTPIGTAALFLEILTHSRSLTDELSETIQGVAVPADSVCMALSTALSVQKILFVDDDEDIRTIAHLSLTAVGGWQVALAGSGPRAIEQAVLSPPDLIILDVMMPGMDGFATLEQLRDDERTAAIPVIFLTAKVQKTEVERYAAAGAGVIAKPFDAMKLPEEIRRILSSMTSFDGARAVD